VPVGSGSDNFFDGERQDDILPLGLWRQPTKATTGGGKGKMGKFQKFT
jgi:hypothetical protein